MLARNYDGHSQHLQRLEAARLAEQPAVPLAVLVVRTFVERLVALLVVRLVGRTVEQIAELAVPVEQIVAPVVLVG